MTFDICNIKIESHFNIVSQIIEDKRAADAQHPLWGFK